MYWFFLAKLCHVIHRTTALSVGTFDFGLSDKSLEVHLSDSYLGFLLGCNTSDCQSLFNCLFTYFRISISEIIKQNKKCVMTVKLMRVNCIMHALCLRKRNNKTIFKPKNNAHLN